MKAPRSFIFGTVARLLFVLVNVLAVYLLLRGHNMPGGGFIGGLATAISFILLSLALGVEETRRILRIDPVRLALAGLGIALLIGVGPMFASRPFLEQFMFHPSLPIVGKVHIGTSLVFDIGVYLVVVGVTCKIVLTLAQSTLGLRALVEEEEARYSSPRETPIELEPAEELLEDTDKIRKELPHAD